MAEPELFSVCWISDPAPDEKPVTSNEEPIAVHVKVVPGTFECTWILVLCWEQTTWVEGVKVEIFLRASK